LLQGVRDNRVVRVARAVSDRYARDSGGYMSAAIAYYGFLSLFPLLLLALSIVGFVLAGRPDLREDVSAAIVEVVPGVSAILGENLDALVRGRAAAGVVGLAGLLWTGTGVAGAARNAVRRIFRQPLPEGIVEDKVRLVLKTIGLGGLALGATALAGLAAGIEASGPIGVVLVIVMPIGTLILDLLLFVAAYRTLAKGRPAWRALLPGAAFAAVGWSLLKLVGAWYASRQVAGSSDVYGTFAVTVGLLLLLYLAARLFVYGAELNVVLAEERDVGARDGKNQGTQGGGVVETNSKRVAPSGSAGSASTVDLRPPGARSTVDLVRSLGSDAALLVRKEIELAKQEVKEGAASKLAGGVLLAVAGVFGLFALGFLATAGARALGLVLPLWAGFLIVGAVFLLGAGIGAAAGIRKLKEAPVGPVKTRETIKEDVEWARAALRR
jgi:membrane protein